jgi:hypothetical protein
MINVSLFKHAFFRNVEQLVVTLTVISVDHRAHVSQIVGDDVICQKSYGPREAK